MRVWRLVRLARLVTVAEAGIFSSASPWSPHSQSVEERQSQQHAAAAVAAGFTIRAFLPLTVPHRELFTWTGSGRGRGCQFILRTFEEKTLFLQEILSN